jgi:PIN domain nuclease of toxin-antitoxin system
MLLDTHVLIWLAEGSADLSRRSRELIDEAAARDGLAVSAISFWEVAMLCERGRISLSRSVEAWRGCVLEATGIAELPVTGEVAIGAVLLPGPLHADPADRLLVATARLGGLVLGTRDRRLLSYAKSGHVKAMRL